VDFVALGKQEFGQIGTILASDTGNQSFFHRGPPGAQQVVEATGKVADQTILAGYYCSANRREMGKRRSARRFAALAARAGRPFPPSGPASAQAFDVRLPSRVFCAWNVYIFALTLKPSQHGVIPEGQMLKHVAVLGVSLALSFSASAGLIQYNFDQVSWSDGGSLNGYFVQDEVSRKILHYDFTLQGGDGPQVTYTPEEPFGNLTRVSLGAYPSAPTYFEAYAMYMGGYSTVGFAFHPTADGNVFAVAGWNEELYQPDPNDLERLEHWGRTVASGFVSSGAVDPWVADYLANLPPGAPGGIADLTPLPAQTERRASAMQVPEPATLALLLAGAGGALAVRRRQRRS
jgi:hypothetical protein